MRFRKKRQMRNSRHDANPRSRLNDRVLDWKDLNIHAAVKYAIDG